MSEDDGLIEYSKLSRRELLEAYKSIDSDRYPINYQNLLAALDRTKSEPPEEASALRFRSSLSPHAPQTYQQLDHIGHAWPILIAALVFLIPLWASINEHSQSGVRSAWVIAIVFSLFVTIPLAVIHWRHFTVSRGTAICFDLLDDTVLCKSNHGELRFGFAEVVSLRVVISAGARTSGSFQLYAWQSYGYAVVNFDNGLRLVVSSLLVPVDTWKSLVDGCEFDSQIFPWPPKCILATNDT